MKIRKKLFLSSLAITGLLTVCSCHGTLVAKTTKNDKPTPVITVDPTDPNKTIVIEPTQSNPEIVIEPFDFSDVDTTKEYTITFWDKNDSNKLQTDVFENAIKKFNEYYPNITIKMNHYTDYGRLYEDILLNISTNTTPNIAISYPDHVAVYAQNSSLMVKMDSLMYDEKYGLGGSEVKFNGVSQENLISKYVNEGYLIVDNVKNLYTLPFMRSTECLYVNKTWLLEHNFEIPENEIFTWDYIWEICKWAKENDPTIVYPFLYQSQDNFFITLDYQYGYDYTTIYGDILFANDDNKNLVKMLDEYNSKGYFTIKNAIGAYPSFYMNTGKEIFAVDSSAGSTWIGSDCPIKESTDEETDYEYELLVTTVPQADANNPSAISQGPSLCIFNKEDKGEVWASWMFLQFLLTDEVQVGYSKTEGYVPVTYSARNTDEFKALINGTAEVVYEERDGYQTIYHGHKDALNVALKYMESTFITPAFNKSSAVREAVGDIMYFITIGKQIATDEQIDTKFKKALKSCGVK